MYFLVEKRLTKAAIISNIGSYKTNRNSKMTPFYQNQINKSLSTINALMAFQDMTLEEIGKIDKFDVLSEYKTYLKISKNENGVLHFNVEQAVDILEDDIKTAKDQYENFPALFDIKRKARCENWESWDVIYMVKASNLDAAIEMLYKNGYEVYGRRITTDYDCSGLKFSDGVYKKYCRWNKAHKCYEIPVTWHIDC